MSTKLDQIIYDQQISMGLIFCLIGPDRPELFALELGKIAAFDLVTL